MLSAAEKRTADNSIRRSNPCGLNFKHPSQVGQNGWGAITDRQVSGVGWGWGGRWNRVCKIVLKVMVNLFFFFFFFFYLRRVMK